MRLAILGGSFDPVHNGHLALAESVYSLLHYDKVVLIPSFVSPHKQGVVSISPKDRLEMLRLAVSGKEYLDIDDCELSREGVSYTIDTLRNIVQSRGTEIDGKIGLVIGSDLAQGFSSWKESALIPEYADVILGFRPGQTISSSLSFSYIKLENTLYDVSSSMIRRAIAQGSAWSSLVPESVYRYIVKHGLYES